MPWDGDGNPIRTDGVRTGRVVFENERRDRVLVNTRSMDTHANDMADMLANCITRDSQTPPSQDISWGNHRLTDLQNAGSETDAVNLRQLLEYATPYVAGGSVGGTANAIELEPTVAVTSYEVGTGYRFIVPAASTGRVTLAVSGQPPQPVRLANLAEAAAPGALAEGRLVTAVWTGTFWLTDVEPENRDFHVASVSMPAAALSLADLFVLADVSLEGRPNRTASLQQLKTLLELDTMEPPPPDTTSPVSADRITGVLGTEHGGTGQTSLDDMFAAANVSGQRETRRDIFGGLTSDEIASIFQQVNPGFVHPIRGMTSDGTTLWLMVNTFNAAGVQQAPLAARAFTLATKARDASRDIVDTGDVLNNAGGGSGGAVIHNSTHIWLGNTGSRGWMRAWTKQGVRAANLDFLAIHPGNPVFAAASDGSTAWITEFTGFLGTIQAWDLTASPPTAIPARNVDKADLGLSTSDSIYAMATDGETLWIGTRISNRGAVLPWNLARAAADPAQDVPGDALPAALGGMAYAGNRLYVGGTDETGVVAYRFIEVLIRG